MQYQNAYEGLKKVFRAELLTILAAVFVLIALISAFAAGVSFDAVTGAVKPGDFSGGALLGAGICVILGGILSIVAFVLNIIGLHRAGKDQSSFKTALVVTIVAIVISVVSGVKDEGAVGAIFETLISFCELLIMILVIQGITTMASQVGVRKMIDKGKVANRLILLMVVAAVVLNILKRFMTSPAMMTVGTVLAIIALILMLMVYVYYLAYIRSGYKMLEKAGAASGTLPEEPQQIETASSEEEPKD